MRLKTKYKYEYKIIINNLIINYFSGIDFPKD